MSSAADDSPEMSRFKFSERKKINKYKLSFFFFFFAAVVIGAIWINKNCTEGSARLYINP